MDAVKTGDDEKRDEVLVPTLYVPSFLRPHLLTHGRKTALGRVRVFIQGHLRFEAHIVKRASPHPHLLSCRTYLSVVVSGLVAMRPVLALASSEATIVVRLVPRPVHS